MYKILKIFYIHIYKCLNKFDSILCPIQSFIFLQPFNIKVYQTHTTVFKPPSTFKIFLLKVKLILFTSNYFYNTTNRNYFKSYMITKLALIRGQL